MPLGGGARAGTAYGTINNFDTVNDTGMECHGFEIEIEDLRRDITYTYNWNHYDTPRIVEDNSGEAKADRVAPDGIHGAGVKTINGIKVDLSTVVVVGEYVGAQMFAFDVDAPVGLIEHLQDGVVNEPYPTRTVVIAGNAPFTATTTGQLPAGMSFNRVSGELSGTPTETGAFLFTVAAQAGNDPVVRRTYTLTIAEAGVALPPRSAVDTVASPLDRGTTTGDGTYTNGTAVTVMATPAAGFVFANWTDNRKVVSSSATYTFANIINRSLVANFVPEPPRLSHSAPQPGTLALAWPTNAVGYVLQRNANLNTTNWANVTNVATVVGTNQQVTISPLTGPGGFFRLIKP